MLRRIDREGRDRGRGQVTGVGWARSEAAALLAEDDSLLQGLRDGAIIRLMSDTLARISEVAALQCSDVEPDITAGGGTVHIRASKTDQRGEGSTRYIGSATMAALERYLAAAGHTTGPLFRRVLRGGHGSAKPLAAGSIGEIVRKRLRAVGSPAASAATRCGWAAPANRRPPAPAWRSCSRPAAGGRPLRRRSTSATRPPPAGRWRAAATKDPEPPYAPVPDFDLVTSAVARWWC